MNSANGVANPSSVLAELVDHVTGRLQAGEAVDWDGLVRDYPQHAAELNQLRPALKALDDLSRSGAAGASGVGTPADTLDGVLGDFRIVREIGRGGMGVVYEAEQISLRRRVALKVLPFAGMMDPRHLQRFHNEAQAAACLHHGNIVPVYFVGSDRSVHFYAMQMIEGQTLAAIVRDLARPKDAPPVPPPAPAVLDDPRTIPYRPTPPAVAPTTVQVHTTALSGRGRDYFRAVARLGVQAAEALDYAHQMGVVHRDIKPANLMIDGRGTLWVTDFGLAHIQHGDTGLTMTGDLVGTLRYMSPEQALAKRVPIDHRTDVYSLGVTLYELLTLCPAFAGEDRQDLLRQVAFEEPTPVRQLNKAVPRELETIVLKAMAKNPAERYATAQELADDLGRFMADQPIRARRPTWRQVAGKWVRRHRPQVFSAATILGIAALTLAGSLGWLASERSVRLSETTRVTNEALDESAAWQQKRRLPEALSAARRAAGLVASGTPHDALRQRVQARVADLELVDKLENVRLEMASSPGQFVILRGHWGDIASAGQTTGYDRAEGDRRYGTTFRSVGLDLDALPTEESGVWFRQSTVATEVAAALDNWAIARRRVRPPADRSWKHLLDVARVADPDAQRNRIRDALEQGDRQALLDQADPDKAFRLEPSTVAALGWMLLDVEAPVEAEALLRKAQRLHPDDYWINHYLAAAFASLRPPNHEEALRYRLVAVALRPRSPDARIILGESRSEMRDLDGAIAENYEAIELDPKYARPHNGLGNALLDKKDVDGAIREYRAAIDLDSKYASPHFNLGTALLEKKEDVDGAIKEYRAAIELDPRFAAPHSGLGAALRAKKDVNGAMHELRTAIELDPKHTWAYNGLGVVLLEDKKDVEGAIKEFCFAIELRPKDAELHFNLGNALWAKKDMEGAIREYRAAIALHPKHARAHENLGHVLVDTKDMDGAIREYHAAIELEQNNAVSHYGLGVALRAQGNMDGAIREFRAAIELDPKHALPHLNLGLALQTKGQFVDALSQLRRGHELGSADTNWPHPSAQWVREAELLVEIDQKLLAVLEGNKKTADANEYIEFARFCLLAKHHNVAATGFYEKAFDLKADLVEDRQVQHRYDAACAAALAGCGQGKDAPSEGKERASCRQRSLTWLRAEIETWRAAFEKDRGDVGPTLAKVLAHWQVDTDLEGVRTPEALGKLPEAERGDWQQLWKDVEQLRKTAADKPASKP